MKLNNKGFTLVEVIAAVVIISLLTIIVIPNVFSTLNTGKQKSYEIVVENIVTASKELFEEVYANEILGVSDTSYLYHYESTGEKGSNKIEIEEGTNQKIIEINLQTLVSNGFLSGSNNDTGSGAKKVILNPKTDTKENMGGCEIKIIRTTNSNSKVTYTIESSSSESYCPTTDDYKKGVN